LSISIPCFLAAAGSSIGGLLVVPTVLLALGFFLVYIFGPGRGPLSSLIATMSVFFGNRGRALTVAAILLLGALGAALITVADYLGAGCEL
jgi:hypothetical protein